MKTVTLNLSSDHSVTFAGWWIDGGVHSPPLLLSAAPSMDCRVYPVYDYGGDKCPYIYRGQDEKYRAYLLNLVFGVYQLPPPPLEHEKPYNSVTTPPRAFSAVHLPVHGKPPQQVEHIDPLPAATDEATPDEILRVHAQEAEVAQLACEVHAPGAWNAAMTCTNPRIRRLYRQAALAFTLAELALLRERKTS